MISLAAIYISQKKPSANYSWGYSRAEPLGALLSIFLIWILTYFLVMEAFEQFRNRAEEIDGKSMFVLAIIVFKQPTYV